MLVSLATCKKHVVFLQVANKNGILPNMKKYWSGSHTKHKLMYHLVWIPKYRKRVLKGAVAKRIEELLRQCAEVNEWEIDELNVQQDHIHMLV